MALYWTYQKRFKNIPAAGIYLFKINNRKTKIMREICSKSTLKTPEWRYRRHWRRFGFFIRTFEQISCIFPILWTSKCRSGRWVQAFKIAIYRLYCSIGQMILWMIRRPASKLLKIIRYLSVIQVFKTYLLLW